jgi:hypothetical protein
MKALKATKTTVLLAPQTLTHGSTTTANFDLLDVKGEAEIMVSFGALAGAGTAPSSIVISEADTTDVSNFTEISTSFSTGAAAVGANESVRFIVNRANGGRKRYLRLAITTPSGSTNSNILASAVGRVVQQGEDPASTSEYGSTVVREV